MRGARKPAGRISARETIENTPRIKTHEMAWVKYKKKPGKIFPYAKRRYKQMVRFRGRSSRVRSYIHSHTPTGRKISSRPSAYDYALVFEEWRLYKTRKSHIIVISPSGKVMGYFSMMTGKRTKKLSRKTIEAIAKKLAEYDRLMNQKMKNNEKKKIVKEAKKLLKTLIDEKLLLIRTTPMPGFAFNKNKREFVKK
ncbi:MAG TPA: hypothetical protein VI977_04690 [archaeon]|nr:hypothetical protein [archaeon]